MIRAAVAVGGCFILSACDAERAGDEADQAEQTLRYSIDPETGETAASIETESGTATVRSGADVPVELPAGFALFPGAEIMSNTRFDEDGGNRIVLLTFASDAAPLEIAAFYREAAEAAGFAIMIDTALNDGALMTGENEQGAVFTLSTSRRDDRTIGQLTTGLGSAAR
ncbi:hypothetical protein [Erythrobacter sp. MTPC3]|uniref:hypothetical protein n=1 Tax=Erythrobacter sp. MTPC3 TaxID=3056564 RepID=UPI0036F2CFD9